MRQRAIIHVDGPDNVGKTTFIETLLRELDEMVICIRGKRDNRIRAGRESAPKTNAEIRQYKAAGACAAALYRFPMERSIEDAFYTLDVMEEYSTVVIIEGDCPTEYTDFSVFIAPPLPNESSLWIQQQRDHSDETEASIQTLKKASDNPDELARYMADAIGLPISPDLMTPEFMSSLKKEIDSKLRKLQDAPLPTPTLHWTVAPGYRNIEHAKLVVVNRRDDSPVSQCDAVVQDMTRLRKNKKLFDDVLGYRGQKPPITAVSACIIDPKDKSLKKAVSRVKRAIDLCRKHN